jgi:hypothetical protein
MTLSCIVEKLFPLSLRNEKTRLLEKEYDALGQILFGKEIPIDMILTKSSLRLTSSKYFY